jgi:hypothetical protein
MLTQFKTEIQSYTPPDNIDVDSICIDILFYNETTVTVFINGFPVAAGATYAINGNEKELNTTKYKISWNGATTGAVFVTRRKYVSL